MMPDYLTIPLQLVRDREIDAIDRMVYGVIYWYEHMKDGKCFASNESMAQIIGTTARVIQNSLSRLEDRGYILREYKDAAKRNRSEIKSLVAFKYVRSMDDRQKTSDPQMTDVSSIDDSAYDPQMTRVIKGSNKNEREHAAHAAGGVREKFTSLGADILKAFEPINPACAGYYNRPPQRAACDRLIKQHGFERVVEVIGLLPRTNRMAYMPTITTPYQLEAKWAQLDASIQKHQSKIFAEKDKFKVAF